MFHMPSPDGFTRLRLLGAGGLPLRTRFNKRGGWLVKVSEPYVVTGQQHKVRKVTNGGTRLCSYIPETRNVVISEHYTLKTSNSQQGVLKMVSEFSPAGIIGVGLPSSTILLEIILGDRFCRCRTRLQAQVDPSACE